ncbi:MAG TPA: arsenic resistance N-acetyltransferase ArsN2 [Gemmatimonadaceae bacterium]|nr:arsenic resistance N-acetyltransferase ArsN2 [Gemmatimonadaceae bacterium]
MSLHATPDGAYRIREASSADLERVRELLVAAALPLDGLDEQFGPSYAVAESDETIIGVEGIEIYDDDGLLRSAAVDPTWRGRGVGDALTRNRIEWARQSGLHALYLLTTTAGAYFPRFGFVAESRDAAPEGIRRSREFTDACPATALFMRLPLSENQ